MLPSGYEGVMFELCLCVTLLIGTENGLCIMPEILCYLRKN